MAVVATISGAWNFTTTDLAGAEAFIEAVATAKSSGANVFAIPAANGTQFYIGIVEV